MVYNVPIPDVDWVVAAPYAVMAIAGILALLIHMFRRGAKNGLLVTTTLIGCVVGIAALVGQMSDAPVDALGEAVRRDPTATGLQIVVLLSTALIVLFSEPYLRQKQIAFGEFYSLISWGTVGAMLMVGTNNLLTLFLGLEILSVSLYVMAGMSRREQRSEEAAIKYFLLGAFASAFLLFGIAFLYGASGSLDLSQVSVAWVRNPDTHVLIVFGLALSMIGLGFKASFVPFHQWTPDVYQGAPTNVSAFMATVAKVGALGAVWRVLMAMSASQTSWYPALAALAILTMLVGNLVALTQKDVKRILAYSSIANSGYALVAIIAGSALEARSSAPLVYFLLSYSLMTIGSFAVLTMAASGGREATSINDLRGLWQRSPFAAITLAVCMVSLIGIPPTSGFVGKLLIFKDAVGAQMWTLALALAVGSTISIYYYLQIAFAAFATTDEETSSKLAKPTPALVGACAICVAGIVGLAVFFAPVMHTIVGAAN